MSAYTLNQDPVHLKKLRIGQMDALAEQLGLTKYSALAEMGRLVAAQGGQEALPSLAAPLQRAIKKLERFNECAEDSDSGGCDIGRRWFDTLTHLGLLERTQRSPAEWTMTPAGHDLLRTGGLAHPPGTHGDTEMLDFMERHQVLVTPEYEGPWEARVYGDNEKPFITGVGKTPRAAIADAIAHQGRKAGA